ncbi:hypothetical protein FB567DRAFT_514929 [Paraphoma chrysanthemicola]|uniref:Secreted protein n=1 Tax=Paraphoma chrysanthemicola TaxID=798071 RepID=A0A8K0RFR9_9PLEO|nr:hypothetical protein FB567DRAFT_514929 [Paraphoma chrysanthemicola]
MCVHGVAHLGIPSMLKTLTLLCLEGALRGTDAFVFHSLKVDAYVTHLCRIQCFEICPRERQIVIATIADRYLKPWGYSHRMASQGCSCGAYGANGQ